MPRAWPPTEVATVINSDLTYSRGSKSSSGRVCMPSDCASLGSFSRKVPKRSLARAIARQCQTAAALSTSTSISSTPGSKPRSATSALIRSSTRTRSAGSLTPVRTIPAMPVDTAASSSASAALRAMRTKTSAPERAAASIAPGMRARSSGCQARARGLSKSSTIASARDAQALSVSFGSSIDSASTERRMYFGIGLSPGTAESVEGWVRMLA